MNNLLQGEYFSEIDLATIARRMDDEEKQRMAEGGTNSDEYQQFLTVCVIRLRMQVLKERRKFSQNKIKTN